MLSSDDFARLERTVDPIAVRDHDHIEFGAALDAVQDRLEACLTLAVVGLDVKVCTARMSVVRSGASNGRTCDAVSICLRLYGGGLVLGLIGG
jgi:hypothetical protein